MEPQKQILLIPIFVAFSKALIIFLLLPLVVIPISKSFFFPIASTCLEKTSSKLKSFPIADIVDIFSDMEIHGNGLLFLILNESFGAYRIAETFTFISAFSLSALHIYNLKYCQCKDETCCTND